MIYIYKIIYITYSEVKIHYLKYFGILTSSVLIFPIYHIYKLYYYIFIHNFINKKLFYSNN